MCNLQPGQTPSSLKTPRISKTRETTPLWMLEWDGIRDSKNQGGCSQEKLWNIPWSVWQIISNPAWLEWKVHTDHRRVDIAFISQGQTEKRWHTQIRIIAVYVQKDLLQRYRWGVRNHMWAQQTYAIPGTEGQGQQLIKGRRTRVLKSWMLWEERTQGINTRNLLSCLPLIFCHGSSNRKLEVHRESFDAAGGVEKEGQMEDSGTCKKGCLWTD